MSQNLYDKMTTFIRRTTGTDCSKVQRQLFAYLEGELNPVEQAVIDKHLLTCDLCRRELNQCKRSVGALASAVTEIPSPGDLRPGFYAKLAQSRQPRPIWAGWRVAVPALAAVALVAVFARPWLFTKSSVNPAPLAPASNNLADARSSGTFVRGVEAGHPAAPAVKPDERHSIHVAGEARRQPKNRHTERRGYIQYARLAPPPRQRQRPVQIASVKPGRVTPALDLARAKETYALSAAARSYVNPDFDSLRAKAGDRFADRDNSKFEDRTGEVVLASLVNKAELHVSDEERDFMSSTHINGVQLAHGKSGSASVDDDNETAQQPVELPALP